MDKIERHLVGQLDSMGRVEEFEWALHRGFRDGVAQTKEKLFAERIMRPEHFVPLQKLPNDASLVERVKYLLDRIRKILKDVDPVSAIRRWRIRRVLRKLSKPPTTKTSTTEVGNGVPLNIDQLRNRLSAITALRSTQSITAAAEAEDVAAAKMIEDAPVIESEVKLDKKLLEEEKVKVVERKKLLEGADGKRGRRRWVYALHKGGPVDWSNTPIPGMAR